MSARTMVMAAFAADALALPAHWIYDTVQIEARYGRVTELTDPRPPTYHAGKRRGDFTHYGDQTLLLLGTLAGRKPFDAERFAAAWQGFFRSYTGYFDGATRKTLQNLEQGRAPLDAGSPSTDLAGAARIAPLVFAYRRDEAALVEAARLQTRLTHQSPEVLDSAEFFARAALRVLGGLSPGEALRRVRDEFFAGTPLAGWVEAGLASAGQETRAAIGGFGQACETEEAFPGVVHLAVRYADRLEEGLIENVMAGGDSAARGMLAGMLLGAHPGSGGLPERWAAGLAARPQIDAHLARLEAAA